MNLKLKILKIKLKILKINLKILKIKFKNEKQKICAPFGIGNAARKRAAFPSAHIFCFSFLNLIFNIFKLIFKIFNLIFNIFNFKFIFLHLIKFFYLFAIFVLN